MSTRSSLTILGVAASVGLLVLSIQWNDSLNYLGQSYFFHAQHQDATIGLAEPQSDTIIHDFEHLLLARTHIHRSICDWCCQNAR